jgi:competence protein ComEA
MAPPSSAPPKPPGNHAAKNARSWPSYLLVALVTASVTGAAALLLNRPQPQPIVLHPPPSPVSTSTPSPTDTPAPIVVFVSGAVRHPGLYTLPPEARVADALTAAGGYGDEADVNAVNQAERLWDGAQVHVPAAEEIAVEPPAGVSGATRSSGAVLDVLGKVNLNDATLEELDSLPGIGPAKAQAIIDGRPYASIEDLERVPGIGAKTIEQLRDLVTVQ